MTQRTERSNSGSQRGDARARLLEATVRTIQERGRSGATAREIASAAEANLGAIVYYFGSKDELVDQALVTACKRWTDSLKTSGFATAAGATAGERLASSLGGFLDSLAGNRSLAVAFLEALASAERSPSVRSALRDSYADLREAVAERNGDGTDALGLGSEAAEAVAGLVVALFDGLFIQWLVEPDLELNPLELVASMGSLVGTSLADAGFRRIQRSGLAGEARKLVGQADDPAGDVGNGDKPRGHGRRRKGSQRGEIYRLKPPRGSRAQAGARYVVLLQAGELLGLRTALVAPTSRRAAPATFRPEIDLAGAPARVLVERLRTVERERLEERTGRLSAEEQGEVDEAMAAVLALG
jgi:AcrR family transcriptional regulator/mRNA-degrading endonuclease toxin of MazEF toxin-antitoxin module